MRIRHLLTHTCGLPDMPPNNDALRKAHSGLASFVRAMTRADLTFTPGTRIAYSSMGTLIVGEIVERVTKQAFADYAAERVFRPLGMTQTWFRPPEALYPRIAVLRLPEGRKAVNWDNNSPYWRQLGAPWGGLFATADDLARFSAHVIALVTGGATEYPVIGPTAARLMVQNHTRAIPTLAGGSESWGLGWALPVGLPIRFAGDLTSPETFGHHGASGSLIWADPCVQLSCVILTNQMTNWGADVRRYGAFSNAVVASIVR